MCIRILAGSISEDFSTVELYLKSSITTTDDIKTLYAYLTAKEIGTKKQCLRNRYPEEGAYYTRASDRLGKVHLLLVS